MPNIRAIFDDLQIIRHSGLISANEHKLIIEPACSGIFEYPDDIHKMIYTGDPVGPPNPDSASRQNTGKF